MLSTLELPTASDSSVEAIPASRTVSEGGQGLVPGWPDAGPDHSGIPFAAVPDAIVNNADLGLTGSTVVMGDLGGFAFPDELVTLAGSNLVFSNHYSSSVDASYRTAVLYAENELQSHFTDSVMISVSFGYANLNGFLAQNQFGNSTNASYASLKAALQAHATTADDIAAVNSLPSVDPSSGAGFLIGAGMARVLGLPGAHTSTTPDVQLVLGNGFTWNFDPNNRGAANGYDAIGAIEHEISEGGFGRVGGLGDQNSSWAPLDLFRYSSSGHRDYSDGRDGLTTYFSVDGSQMLLPFHNAVQNGVLENPIADPGDWEAGGDAFGYGSPGVIGQLSAVDLRVLDILGWTPTGSTPAQTDDYANTLTDTSHPFGTVNINGVSSTGTIEVNGDHDWFKVTFTAGTIYTIDLQGQDANAGTLPDPVLDLRDSNGTLLAEADDIVPGVNHDSHLVYTINTTGIYYLDVGAWNNQSNGTYKLTVTATAGNQAPVLNAAGGSLNYTENQAATAIDTVITASDADSANLVGATVSISANYQAGQDVLSFVNQNGITGTFNATTGVLTLTGTSSVSNYQAALRSIKYFNSSDNPSGSTRTISYQVDDGSASNHASNIVTAAVTVIPVNDAPLLNANGGSLNYTENQAATAIDTLITVSDVDSANLTSATVRISGNYQSGQDVLSFVNQNGITGSFNAATGVLTLTGTSSVANYQTALRSVAYFNNSDNPSGATRTISYQVDDGSAANHASNTVSTTVTVTPVNDPPVLNANGGSLSYLENQSATAVDPVITVSDADSANLTSGVVWISGNYQAGADKLGFTNQNGIIGTFNAATGVLTLTGTSSAANYQTALRSVTYFNSSDNPSGAARTISYQLDDGSVANHSSNIVSATLTVTPVNDAPSGTDKTVSILQHHSYTFATSDFGFSDVDGNSLKAVKITSAAGAGGLLDNGAAVTLGQFISVSDIASGKFLIVPTSSAYGDDAVHFTFQVQDDGGTANGGVDLDATPNTFVLNVKAAPPNDFDGDGKSDILWRHDGGATLLWEMNGVAQNVSGSLGNLATQWHIGGTGDFDRDGKSDILWRHDNGDVFIWEMNGFAQKASASLGNVTTQWQIAGTADFDGDGSSDVLWRHDNGDVFIWEMNGLTQKASANIGTVSTKWHIADTGDFDGDGKADILWRHDTGDVLIWEMNGLAQKTSGSLGNVSTAWHIAGTGDFDGDGKTDILWRHDNGDVLIWAMNGLVQKASGSLGNVSTQWHIVSVGDYDGDGKSDIIWRHDNGDTLIWEMNSLALKTSASLGNVLTAWRIQPSANRVPSGADGTIAMREDVPYVFTASDFGFTDPDGNGLLAVKINKLPGAGSLTNNGVAVLAGTFVSELDIMAGALVFTPVLNANGNGYASLNFQVQDNGGTANGGADIDASPNTLVFNVAPVNDPPSGADRTVDIFQHHSYTFATSDFGFSDVDGNSLNAVKVTAATGTGALLDNGAAIAVGQFIPVSDIAGGKFVFVPIASAYGQNALQLSFQVQDDGGTNNGGINLDQSPNSFVVNVKAAPASDFNGDTKSDILWRHDNGDALIWEMNGFTQVAIGSLGNVSTNWHIARTGDFDGDGKSDIVWRHDGGGVFIWEMNGLAQKASASLGNVSTSWQIAGAGDFDGDGKSDILWRNDNGDVLIWEMNGLAQKTSASLGNVSTQWHIADTGDFDGDGKSDILWRHDNGDVLIWEMNGLAQKTSASLGNVSTQWHIAGTGDFDGDGKADILWRHDNGNVLIGEMDGLKQKASVSLGNVPTQWHIAGVGDYNGDGNADILWGHDNGDSLIWEMNGGIQIASGSLGNVPAQWHIDYGVHALV